MVVMEFTDKANIAPYFLLIILGGNCSKAVADMEASMWPWSWAVSLGKQRVILRHWVPFQFHPPPLCSKLFVLYIFSFE